MRHLPYISYYLYPILAGLIWLATLLALLLYWLVPPNARVHYSSMAESQHIAYISDVGASTLKPLFITGCVLTTIFLDISFGADYYLRHKGRLVPNQTRTEKVLSFLTIGFAIIGTAGLILLSVFDTARHPKLHNIFLLFFIAGYVLSAIFICWEYQRLGQHYKHHHHLSTSFWIKLTFVIVEILLAIAFVSCTFTKHYNAGAVLEWVIAFIFSAYVFSFVVDLWPAIHTQPNLHLHNPRQKGMGFEGVPAGQQQSNGTGDMSYVGASEMEEGGSSGSHLPIQGLGFGNAAGGPAMGVADHGGSSRPVTRDMTVASNF
ncbi:Frag1/DRAM/Sfk1 family-domain-containing protein [Triangularia verruculosa]|uniref:Frag1/DRAM/Sfk1 family-domain-containing protein n=1 Tax=Triangularia verruculosa TaxID=2587418 RepID=A0AAN6XN36_9PEZI|nr:Frag1/DRAM/Sfk1 family-domain-containing protein [Triangularia verruculosa]